MQELQRFQFIDKYSRWNDKKNRRETWTETVTRAVNYLRYLSDNKLSDEDYVELWNGIHAMEVMPSMRLLAMAGDAAKKVPVSVFNCSFIGINRLKSISEALYISMAGCGVGYSVEHKYINQLPKVQPKKYETISIIVEDSALGWAMAVESVLEALFNGYDVDVDYSLIRPAGSVLKTKGGRASGPQPLITLINKIKEAVNNAQNRQLTSLEVHDIMTTLCGCVVSGGQRRAAMLCLFDFDDDEMRYCKNPENIKGNENRWYANNSANITSELSYDEIANIMDVMHSTSMGEPGIFSSYAAKTQNNRRTLDYDRIGINPCGEIILRNNQFCNLTAAIARQDDTRDSLMKKVRLATILGTIQSLATNFNYLDPIWQFNTEDERLLGVDITGQYDCPYLWTDSANKFTELKEYAIQVNKEYAKKLGIRPSTAITTNKPSGNSSVLLDCASGIHPRHAKHYIRRVRINANSPVFKMLQEQNFPLSPENNQDALTATTWVASFPIKSPNQEGKFKKDVSAIEQLEWWKMNKVYWTEHNPSFTCSYYPEELGDIKQWLFENQNIIGGLSFLPQYDFAFSQAPYEEISEDVYNLLEQMTPKLDWTQLQKFEENDRTEAAQTLACVAGNCEI